MPGAKRKQTQYIEIGESTFRTISSHSHVGIILTSMEFEIYNNKCSLYGVECSLPFAIQVGILSQKRHVNIKR